MYKLQQTPSQEWVEMDMLCFKSLKIMNTLNCEITDIMEFTSQEVDVQNTDGVEEDK